VLLDLSLPTMDGFQFLDRLNDSIGPMPTIVITSMVLDDERRFRLRAASRILSKSALTGDALVGAIRAAVGAREARAS
jgi:CheY-like chemotaxis protein